MAMNRVETLLDFLREDPHDPFVQFALASEYLKAGDEESALQWFEKLVEEQPDYVGTYYHLGRLYRRLGRSEDAMRTYENGIEAATRVNDFHAASELRNAKMEMEIGD
jgi:tetratricopeptide (TPR) repeat protein